MGTRTIVDLVQKVTTFSSDNTRYVRTHVKAVDGLLGGDGLLDMALLPTSLKSGLKPIGALVWSASVSALNTFDAIWGDTGTFDSGDGVFVGDFVIVDSSLTNSFTVSSGHIITNGDDGGGQIVGTGAEVIQLEKNDWVVYMGTDGTTKLWQIVNHTYPLVTAVSSGLMSAAQYTKLAGLENYNHATDGADVTLTANGVQKIAGITVNNLGHVTSVSLETIQDGDQTQKGIIQLATQEEARSSTALTTKAVSKERVIDIMKYFEAIKLYAEYATAVDNLAAANGSFEHGEGALVLIKSGTVEI